MIKSKTQTMEINVIKTIEVSPEDVNDIMVTALAGGISYWCKKAKIVEGSVQPENLDKVKYKAHAIGYGGSLKLYDSESDETWVLTPDKFQAGLQKFIDSRNLSEVDPGMIDAGDADEIVQLALFNEITFG